MQLSQEKKNISYLFLDFQNSNLILNIFKRKMTFIPDVLLHLRTPKDVVR